MEVVQRLLAAVVHYTQANFQPGGPYGLPSLAGTTIVVFAYFAFRRRAAGLPLSARTFFAWLFPRRIIFHKSSLMDVRLWLINATVFGVAFSWLAVSGLWVRDLTVGGLTHAFGAHAPAPWPWGLVMSLTTLLALLAYEFGYWFGHYLFHRYAFLWEFHKVHHSAEVMTTFTELRQHPVEILAFINIIALTTGVTLGALTYVFGPGAQAFTLLNANIALFLFLMTWGHLRHSHIWWAFTGALGHLFQSPAHHQLHHSDHPDHWDKNLGFALAVWDWLFGTLVLPHPDRKVQNVHFGVGETNGDYDTVMHVLVRPFIRSAEHFAPTQKQQPVPAPSVKM
jgi:sterol desaturase/sphingolipid hydroxylase (fatty acid hydroxylase superfamily)